MSFSECCLSISLLYRYKVYTSSTTIPQAGLTGSYLNPTTQTEKYIFARGHHILDTLTPKELKNIFSPCLFDQEESPKTGLK